MVLVARKVVNSLDKEIIIKSGSEYWHIKSVQVVNTSELQWLRRTKREVDYLIKNDGFKSYEIKDLK